ncbi:hypothetical protein GCM10009039_11860 [Halocalculus aciditolerans]|uniref:Uncharacterized protein n=1 Tax=Halocalculus aciditolerans TaxID=1383812 RepID=A0A830FI89_9EURY|nr:hypothetical protein GCM10009039_11860 [Halocalculus aciditolerans]
MRGGGDDGVHRENDPRLPRLRLARRRRPRAEDEARRYRDAPARHRRLRDVPRPQNRRVGTRHRSRNPRTPDADARYSDILSVSEDEREPWKDLADEILDAEIDTDALDGEDAMDLLIGRVLTQADGYPDPDAVRTYAERIVAERLADERQGGVGDE